jgi:CubicO group peptidase (beta-lactamase class C family)
MEALPIGVWTEKMRVWKSFCCLQARTIDFAKFGRLYLNKGNWEGNQIVSRAWVSSQHIQILVIITDIITTIMGNGPLKYNSFYAVGLYGQYLYLYPEKNIQIIRFGDSSLSYNPNYWQDILFKLLIS